MLNEGLYPWDESRLIYLVIIEISKALCCSCLSVFRHLMGSSSMSLPSRLLEPEVVSQANYILLTHVSQIFSEGFLCKSKYLEIVKMVKSTSFPLTEETYPYSYHHTERKILLYLSFWCNKFPHQKKKKTDNFYAYVHAYIHIYMHTLWSKYISNKILCSV